MKTDLLILIVIISICVLGIIITRVFCKDKNYDHVKDFDEQLKNNVTFNFKLLQTDRDLYKK